MDWIEPQQLQELTEEFVRFVEHYAELHGIPIIPARVGEDHVEQAAEYLDRFATQERGVYCIIKVQEETSSFVSYATVASRFVEKLGQPTVREDGQRVPGLNLHNPRLYLVLAHPAIRSLVVVLLLLLDDDEEDEDERI